MQQTNVAEVLRRNGVTCADELWPNADWPLLSTDDALDLPALVVACPLNDVADADEVHTLNGALAWSAVFHQTAGVACHHHHLAVAPLTPRPHIVREMASLVEDYWESDLGAFTPPLTTLVEYNRRLSDRFGVTCNRSYQDLAEGIYPVDASVGTWRTLSSVPPPSSLHDLLTFPSPLRDAMGVIGRWRMYILSENSD